MGPNLPNLMKIPFAGPLPQAFHSNPVRMGEVASLSVPENAFKENSLPEDWMATSHICARSDMGVAKWTRPSMQLKSLTHACAQGRKNLGLKIKRERETWTDQLRIEGKLQQPVGQWDYKEDMGKSAFIPGMNISPQSAFIHGIPYLVICKTTSGNPRSQFLATDHKSSQNISHEYLGTFLNFAEFQTSIIKVIPSPY